jgi:hypothetical protein
VCYDAGLNGEQGVIIPKANLNDLMLKHEVVEACEAGSFHVFAVEDVGQALELFTGFDAGKVDEEGDYPERTLFARVVEQAGIYWVMASRQPVIRYEEGEQDEEEPEDEEQAEEQAPDAAREIEPGPG